MSEPVKSPGPTTRSSPARGRRAHAGLAILAAARDLFAEEGYAATLGPGGRRAAAEVAVDTVYAKVGRKPQLLIAVHDLALAEGPAPLPAEQRDYVRAVRAAPTAAAKLRTYADGDGSPAPGHGADA